MLYAGLDEVHQSWVPMRAGRAVDVLIDALGAGIGLGLSGSRRILGRRS